MKTKIQELILGLALLLLTPLAAQAQFTFVTNNGAITITRYTGSGGAVVIPETIGFNKACLKALPWWILERFSYGCPRDIAMV